MNWRVDIAKCPLVGRQLPIRMHIPFMKEQKYLLLGKIHINQAHCYAMECQVPRCEPGIFPGIRHNNDVSANKMSPASITITLWRWCRFSRIAMQPFLDIVHVELFTPEQASSRRGHNAAHVLFEHLAPYQVALAHS